MKLYRQTNSYRYSKRIREAEKIIQHALSQSRNPAIALSGGKDSVAMAGLVLKYCKPIIIWNDSGLELPDSKNVVFSIAATYGLKVVIAEGCAMDEAEQVGRGELSRTNRRVMMSIDTITEPVKKVIKENNIDLEFVGLRKKESINRRMLLSQYGPIHESKKWETVIAWPMMNWEGKDCLAYICENDLPIHQEYLESDNPAESRVSWVFDKTREAPAETEKIKRRHPDIYRRLREVGLCQ